MTVQERKESTRSKILRVSMRMFLEVGYTATTVKAVCDELNISKGNFTFYFPTKEYVLAELVRMLCEFQEKLIDYEADRGVGSVLSICIELMTVAAACEENEIARDFFVSAFQSRMCLDYLRENHVNRAKKLLADYCKDWTHEQFVEAEILVQGIDYATIISNEASVPLDVRISAALNQILGIYNIPVEVRQEKIDRVLAMDCRGLGKRVHAEFTDFVEKESN
ncbi:MAG: TetR/AcrR family transcriptional regulator [Clostridia bacterium]|nr:TetR/AcrR family transcriptional regulator [Clostridia bacterium]